MDRRLFALCMLGALLTCTCSSETLADSGTKPPDIGSRAPDFTLEATDGKQIGLWGLTAQKPVILVVLRGYPGYQCPLCNSQVADFVANAQKIEMVGAEVVFVYPGPATELKQRAKDLLGSQTLPTGFHLVLDPDYKVTALYGLRWDATNETVYPATFLVDSQNGVRYRKVSQSHGDRAKATDVLAVLPKKGS